MMKTTSLKHKIWIYLILFSTTILLFLWFFQVIFINKYYEWTKIRNIKKIANQLVNSKTISTLNQTLDKISYLENIVIEITTNKATIYTSGGGKYFSVDQIKYDFIKSNEQKKTYRFQSNFFNEKSLTQAIKIEENLYAFITTSLEPLDSTVTILQEQLIIVSFIVLLFSFIIAFFVSRHLSNPIIKISCAAKKIAKGKMNTTFESGSDIKELIELTDSLNEMKKELEKTENLQKDLIANISHDLKTPLTMIRAYAELIRDINYNKKEKRNNNLNIIIEEVDSLTILVNDILDLSKLQASIETLNIEKINLIQLVKTIIKRFDIFTKKDQYHIIFYHNKIEKALINADKIKLEQAIYNLLINAINYTGNDKKVTILLDEKDNYYHLEIADTGKGMSKNEIDQIWNKYYTNKKNHKRNIYGTGLGLSIVKNILTLHKFPYGVISKKEKGTIFYINMPKQDKS